MDKIEKLLHFHWNIIYQYLNYCSKLANLEEIQFFIITNQPN